MVRKRGTHPQPIAAALHRVRRPARELEVAQHVLERRLAEGLDVRQVVGQRVREEKHPGRRDLDQLRQEDALLDPERRARVAHVQQLRQHREPVGWQAAGRRTGQRVDRVLEVAGERQLHALVVIIVEFGVVVGGRLLVCRQRRLGLVLVVRPASVHLRRRGALASGRGTGLCLPARTPSAWRARTMRLLLSAIASSRSGSSSR
tara:strand:- start:89 stop:700 length:612 start_codon:yes stop_codon:yes gene_type:complete